MVFIFAVLVFIKNIFVFAYQDESPHYKKEGVEEKARQLPHKELYGIQNHIEV